MVRVLHETLTFRVFSNCEEILVIMPSAATKDSRDSTCTAERSLFHPSGLPLYSPYPFFPSMICHSLYSNEVFMLKPAMALHAQKSHVLMYFND